MIHNYRHPEDYKPFSGEGCGQVEIINAFAERVGGTVIGDISKSNLILKAETEMR